MRSVVVDLPADVTDDEARLLLALRLFEERRVSAARAAELAGYSRRAFMELLAHRGLPLVNHPAADLAGDALNA
jgi:predicted HTH domain antitoxin